MFKTLRNLLLRCLIVALLASCSPDGIVQGVARAQENSSLQTSSQPDAAASVEQVQAEDAEMVSITISSDPVGASVYTVLEDGEMQKIGYTPLTVERSAGTRLNYAVEANLSDYRPYRGSVSFEKPETVSVWLDRVPLEEKFWRNADRITIEELAIFGDEHYGEPVVLEARFDELDNSRVVNLPWVELGRDLFGFTTYYDGDTAKEWMGIHLVDECEEDSCNQNFTLAFAEREHFKQFFLSTEEGARLRIEGHVFEWNINNWAGLLIFSVTDLDTKQTVSTPLQSAYIKKFSPNLLDNSADIETNSAPSLPSLIENEVVTASEELTNFVDKYNALNEGFDIEAVGDLYSDTAYFYSWGLTPKEKIVQDKTSYFSRWPSREYKRSSDVTIEEVSTDTWNVKFDVEYKVTNLEKTLSGTAYYALTLKKVGNRLVITSESGGVY